MYLFMLIWTSTHRISVFYLFLCFDTSSLDCSNLIQKSVLNNGLFKELPPSMFLHTSGYGKKNHKGVQCQLIYFSVSKLMCIYICCNKFHTVLTLLMSAMLRRNITATQIWALYYRFTLLNSVNPSLNWCAVNFGSCPKAQNL